MLGDFPNSMRAHTHTPYYFILGQNIQVSTTNVVESSGRSGSRRENEDTFGSFRYKSRLAHSSLVAGLRFVHVTLNGLFSRPLRRCM